MAALSLGYAVFSIPFLVSLYSAEKILAHSEPIHLQHEVKVTLKLIQVYVTDKKGLPVLELGKNEFIVYDNGKKQNISEYEKHVISFPRQRNVVQREEIMETQPSSGWHLLPRKFILFFDFAFNNGIGLEKARRSAFHFIDTQLQRTDEVGVLSYSAMKSLTLHEHLTRDRRRIREVIRKVGIQDIAGRAENFEAEYWRLTKQGENPKDASKAGSVFNREDEAMELSIIKTQREESKLQASNFARKIIDLSKALRYIPGPKHIVLFSSGVPYSLITGIKPPQNYPAKFESFEQTYLSLTFEDMLKELSAANCAIYALDTQEASSALSSDVQTRGAFTLQKMASATGGKYFGNINNYEKHLDKIQALTGCYYVLGYYVDDKWDGAYHKIKVEVTRPGCVVHAQKGYFNPKPFKDYNDLERMLHLVDLALSEEPLFQTPVRLPLEIVPCRAESKGNLRLEGTIPIEKIRDVLAGKSEFVAIIFDDNGNIVTLRRNEKETYTLTSESFTFGAEFSLSPGTYQCRLVIRNLETGRGAVASATAVVPSMQPAPKRPFSPDPQESQPGRK